MLFQKCIQNADSEPYGGVRLRGPVDINVMMVKKERKKNNMKNEVRTYKTSKLYTFLYGRTAYETWKAREAEIDALRMSGKYSKKEIAKMYEDNLRLLKSAGEKADADRTRTGSLRKIRVAA